MCLCVCLFSVCVCLVCVLCVFSVCVLCAFVFRYSYSDLSDVSEMIRFSCSDLRMFLYFASLCFCLFF